MMTGKVDFSNFHQIFLLILKAYFGEEINLQEHACSS